MKKKGRKKAVFKEVDLVNSQLTLKTYLSEEVSCEEHCGLKKVEYNILPNYGSGSITEIHFDDITITISNFNLNDNFIFYNEIAINALYLSFLMKGEMIVKVNSFKNEKPYQENESFMAFINNFKGAIKVYNNTPFKELKITVSDGFLKKHGLQDVSDFKNLDDVNLFVPMCNTISSVVQALQKEYRRGLVQRLYLGAKVVEAIALQMENYKTFKNGSVRLSSQKPIKKLFALQQFLKNNLDKNYSLLELSNEIGLSEHILKTEFKRIFNCTVNQYFLEQKMEKAKQLLQNTDCPVYEVAEVVGYKNATHFSAAFKRYFNESPKTYRQRV